MPTLQAFNLPLDDFYIGRTTITGQDYASIVEVIRDRIDFPELCQMRITLPCGDHGNIEVIFWLDGGYRSGEQFDMNHQAMAMIDALSAPHEKLRTAIYGNCMVTGYNPDTRELEDLPPYALGELYGMVTGYRVRI